MTYVSDLADLFEESVLLSPKVIETKDNGFELRFKTFTIHGYRYSSYKIRTFYLTSISTNGLLGLITPRITFGSKFNFGHKSKVGEYILNYDESVRKAANDSRQAKIDAQDKKALEMFKKLLAAEKKI